MDSRPRFSGGPLKGQLIDDRQRREEKLGLNDQQKNLWLADALRIPEWKADFEEYQQLYGSQAASEQLAAEHETRIAAGYERTATRLGVTVEQLRDSAWVQEHAAELRDREHNANLADEIAGLETKRRAIPEPAETAAE